MNNFEFITDKESHEFCLRIARTMMKLFDVSEQEAVGRINRQWHGLELVGHQDLIYQEEENYWAKNIYYGKDSFWWLEESQAKPLPFP